MHRPKYCLKCLLKFADIFMVSFSCEKINYCNNNLFAVPPVESSKLVLIHHPNSYIYTVVCWYRRELHILNM